MNFRALLLAVVFAALSGTLMVLYLRKVEVETSGGAPVRVLMAVRPLDVGVLITEEMLTTQSIPQAWVETRAVRETDKQRILGLKVEIAVKPQQTVQWTDLAITTGGERNLSDLIQPGMRAIGLRGGAEDQSFALVRPGDRVDVFATLPQAKDDTQRSNITLAQNLLVLAVGVDTGGEAVGPRSTDRRDTVLTVSAAVLQIQQISLATERGKLSIAIKPRRGDDNYDATELTYGSLLAAPVAKTIVVPKATGPRALPGGITRMKPLQLDTRESLQTATIGAVVLGTFVVAFVSARNPKSWLNRAMSRYVESLRGQLVSMFIFVDVRPVVAGQFLLAYLVVAAVISGVDARLTFAIPVLLGLPLVVLDRMRKKRIATLEEQSDAFVIALSSAMRSTPSIGDAFISIAKIVSQPLRSEIELSIKQMRLGATLEEALLFMGRRINSRAFDTALTTVLIGQRLGGDVPSTLAKTGAAIRELNRLDRSARSRLSSAKTQMRVIAMVPIAFPFAIERVSPGYFDALRTHPLGWIAVVVAVGLWMAALFLGRRILSVTL